MTPAPSMTVTVAVPCFNGERTLPAVLASVRRQTRQADELLVIDDGSSDGTAAVARRAGADVISQHRNRGLAAARNAALAAARGDVVVFLDDDAVAHPDLVARLCTGYADDLLGGVGGQVIELAGRRTPLADRWRRSFWRQTLGSRPLHSAPFLIGACCSLRRRAALIAGGFSPVFATNGEDVELSVRLRRSGLRLAYDPLARVVHLRHDDLQGLLRMVHRHSRDHVRALRLHGEPWQPVVRAALRWGPVTVASSLRRHSDPGLAALSPLCWAASLAGCLGGLRPLRRDR